MNSTPKTSKSRAAANPLDQGREALCKQAWNTAFSQLSAADREAELEPADLQGLALAAYLIGKEAYGAEILARAHQRFLSEGDTPAAARCAFWLAFALLNDGDFAQAGGWLARARRLLADGQSDCVEHGLLMIPTGIRALREGDHVTAYAAFVEAGAIGERFADNDLMTLARHGQGRALIRRGETARGISLLDEAMVAVTAGEVSPMVAGGVYCSVIEACGEIFDLRRAQEWTAALEKWCSSQQDIVPYRGHCMVRRAELLQLQGAWPDALEVARRASEWLATPAPKPAMGAAFYRIAELHRVRGEFVKAEAAYHQAGRWSRAAQPGLAQLRLAQGKLAIAGASIRRMAEDVKEPGTRAKVLDAYVEIMLAIKDVPAARAAADELSEIATRLNAPLLHTISSRADGAVLLAENDPSKALRVLRRSWQTWCELEAPYEAARVQILMGLAYQVLGDQEAANLEFATARELFQRLGAITDLSRLDSVAATTSSRSQSPLTAREAEVLKLLASGATNRDIARKLAISEKTVARHVSNIFIKLDLSSRAAATAYAYQNKLV
jgi:DNA-binding CsgD family transcriptional regulator